MDFAAANDVSRRKRHLRRDYFPAHRLSWGKVRGTSTATPGWMRGALAVSRRRCSVR